MLALSSTARAVGAGVGPARALSVTSSELANGVRAAAAEFNGPVAAVGVFTDAGTRSESAASSGILSVVQGAQLLEAGPKIAALGGVLRGDVGRDGTQLVASVLKENAGEAAKILAAAASTAPSAAAFAEAQKNALGTMARGGGGDVFEEMHRCAFLDAPYGRPVRGTPESVAALTASDAAPAAGAVAVAGVGHSDLAAFAGLEAAGAASADVPAAAAQFTGSDMRVAYDSLPLAKICFGYEFPTRSAAAALLPSILGATTSSATSLAEALNAHGKLRRDLAEQNAARVCAPFYASYADTALFGLSLECADVRVEDAVWYATDNLVRLAYEVTEGELARAKLAFRADLAAATADPAAAAASLGRSLAVFGAAEAPNEKLAAVEAVTLDDVKKLAYDHIHDCDHALAAVGPIHELPDYNWLRTASYTHAY